MHEFPTDGQRTRFIGNYLYNCSDIFRVVGFEVEPMSVNWEEGKYEEDACDFPAGAEPQMVSANLSRWLKLNGNAR